MFRPIAVFVLSFGVSNMGAGGSICGIVCVKLDG